jgi:APA family basic amino acid/polyamine antiporter
VAAPGSEGSILAFGAALIPIVFAYGGWQNANYVAEEIKDPKRILPICLLLGTAIVALVYVTINVAYLKAVGLGGLAATTTPASDAARLLFGAAGDRFVTAAIAISTFGFLNLCVLAPTRVYYAMAADGAFFPQVARLHPKYQTPSLAIVLQSTWAIALTLTGTY